MIPHMIFYKKILYWIDSTQLIVTPVKAYKLYKNEFMPNV